MSDGKLEPAMRYPEQIVLSGTTHSCPFLSGHACRNACTLHQPAVRSDLLLVCYELLALPAMVDLATLDLLGKC